MKNIEEALTDVTSMYSNNCLQFEVVDYAPTKNLWLVNIRNKEAPGSLLQIEVIDDNGIPKCCVLQKVNVGRTSMFTFMNRLVDALE